MGAAPAIALAAAPVTAAASPDAALLSLAREWNALAAEQIALDDRLHALDVSRFYPPPPAALHWRADDYYSLGRPKPGEPLDRAAIARFRGAKGTHWLIGEEGRAKLNARIDEIIAADDALDAACARVRRVRGYDALNDRSCAASDRQSAIENASLKLRAKTPEGLKFKAQLVHEFRHMEGEHCDNLLNSLLADLGVNV